MCNKNNSGTKYDFSHPRKHLGGGGGGGDSRILSMQELSSDLPEKTDNTLLDSPAFYEQTSHTLFSLPLQALGFVFPDKPH